MREHINALLLHIIAGDLPMVDDALVASASVYVCCPLRSDCVGKSIAAIVIFHYTHSVSFCVCIYGRGAS